jgi:hypothetical protein
LNKEQISLIDDQFSALKIKYPGLSLTSCDGVPIICGPLDFRAEYGGETINGVFNIEINFPEDYPDSPPTAKEIGGCIPSSFHKNQNDILCLSAPVVIKIRFFQNPTLIAFVENIVIPYLYSFLYWEKHGVMPYGQYDHGFKGIIQSYKDLFNNTSDFVVLKLLRILAEGNYRGHLPCPCDSGKKLRHCHGPTLIEVKKGTGKDSFLYDFISYLLHLHKAGKKLPNGIISKRIDKSAKKLFKEINKSEK